MRQYLTTFAIAIISTLFLTTYALCQNGQTCDVGIKETKTDRLILEESFKTKFGQWSKATKIFKIPQTRLFLVVDVTYTEPNQVNDPNPATTRLVMGITASPTGDGKGEQWLTSCVSEPRFDPEDSGLLLLYYRIKKRGYVVALECTMKDDPKKQH